MSAPRITYAWDGEAMRPLPSFARLCDREFVVHERYQLHAERSDETHGHYFAVLRLAFATLPEGHGFADEIHLRKWCLIRTGHRTVNHVVAASEDEARRLALLAPVIAQDYVEVAVDGVVLTIVRALSQSYSAMGGKLFNRSKSDVIGKLAELLDVSADDLARTAKEAA